MSTHVKIALTALLVGLAGIGVYKAFTVVDSNAKAVLSSDAKTIKGKLVVGVDNWIGYFPLCSPAMAARMRHAGYNLVCVDDNADYPERMKKLAAGDYQFAVATVDSYILNGAASRYPGTIVTVIDESKGGDAAVAWKEKVSSLDALKSANNIKIAFTPKSPSHHLLKSMEVHFDIPVLRQNGWQLPTEGSSDALKRFLRKESAVAVLWEPDVSRALKQDGVVKLLGTEDTNKLIVDVLLTNREYSLQDPEAVKTLIHAYFLTLKHYRDQPEELLKDAADATDLKPADVQAMVKGVAWQNLSDNANQWFGAGASGPASGEGIIEAINGAVQILRDANDFSRNPIPDEDPYRLTNSQFVADLYGNGGTSTQWNHSVNTESGDADSANALERTFAELSQSAWERLREIGTLKVRPIVFQSGSSTLTLEGKAELDKAVENLRHYPNFRVVVKGHSGQQGDPQANKELSQERADSVARYMQITYGIDTHRLRPLGLGADRPLPRNPGESDRAYNYRLPRVELFLVAEDI